MAEGHEAHKRLKGTPPPSGLNQRDLGNGDSFLWLQNPSEFCEIKAQVGPMMAF